MWELEYKQSWVPKYLMLLNCGVGEDPWESLDCKEIQPVNPKGNQSWIFIRRAKAEAEAPTLWPPDVKNWLLGKDPDAGKAWGQEEKGMTENEMVGWHHWLNGHEFGQAPGIGDGRGGLVCCRPWVIKSQTQLSNRTDWKSLQMASASIKLKDTCSLEEKPWQMQTVY